MVTDIEQISKMDFSQLSEEYMILFNESNVIIGKLTMYLYAMAKDFFDDFKVIRYNHMGQLNYDRFDSEKIVTIFFTCEFEIQCGFELYRDKEADWRLDRYYSDGRCNYMVSIMLDYEASLDLDRLIEIQRAIDYINELKSDDKNNQDDNKPPSYSNYDQEELMLMYLRERYDESDSGLITILSPMMGMTTLFFNNESLYYTNPQFFK